MTIGKEGVAVWPENYRLRRCVRRGRMVVIGEEKEGRRRSQRRLKTGSGRENQERKETLRKEREKKMRSDCSSFKIMNL